MCEVVVRCQLNLYIYVSFGSFGCCFSHVNLTQSFNDDNNSNSQRRALAHSQKVNVKLKSHILLASTHAYANIHSIRLKMNTNWWILVLHIRLVGFAFYYFCFCWSLCCCCRCFCWCLVVGSRVCLCWKSARARQHMNVSAINSV